jgi:predicted N-acetyltransferase YhbS
MISIATSNDIREICDLMNSTFGPHPKQKEYFEKCIAGSEYVVHVARSSGELIAVATSYVRISSDFNQYEVFSSSAVEFMRNNKLGWFLNMAVVPALRKQKIGNKLAQAQAKWLIENGCTALMGTSWVSGSEDNSAHMFERAGFKVLGKSNEFLRNQLRGTGSLCSACGLSDCECVSILYGLSIER